MFTDEQMLVATVCHLNATGRGLEIFEIQRIAMKGATRPERARIIRATAKAIVANFPAESELAALAVAGNGSATGDVLPFRMR